jgi:hypothetical protein
MKIEINGSVVTLARDGLIALRDAAHAQVFCQSGSLWITREGEIKDVILGPGDRLSIGNRGLTLISALRTSALALVDGESSAPRAQPNIRFVREPVACT